MTMHDIYDRIFDLAKPYLDTRENEEHTRIARDFAATLLRTEGGNPSVVLPAVILHDIGWKHVPEELQITAFGPGKRDRKLNRVHEVEGAKTARSILEAVDYDGDLINEIVEIVEGHDSRLEALSLNDAIVKDADKLWRYSRHGVDVDTVRFQVERYRYVKRLGGLIDEWFFTTTARTLARGELEIRLSE